ncbi:MAG TPA: pyruvate:ferredoxin (flavodoxin) oxidoreductase [Candidatus Polarisedimenticolaceae bacterium]|nr:pyruvate:ferredoxin (flavodoxin) oxidoreductase [Candidatus Polarisedimenticolaceae bacterium]
MATKVVDGNEAAASVAYRASSVIAIYPITPSSPMGELSDEWASRGRPNLWGAVPDVIEMQSEGGAAGAIHGAIQAGALGTTFTASQGLLLMIPNMYKIAGELTPFVMHVAARTVATHALSIFGDHSDVMACRATGFAMLCSNSPQEAHDLAAVAHAATLASRVPFVHFFDGFRTSHELQKVRLLDDDDLRALLPAERMREHVGRGLTPDRPVLRGTAQNPDVFFQAREAANGFHAAVPGHVAAAMDALHTRTGRRYRLFDYAGAEDAEQVLVMMGSGAETAEATIEHLNAKGAKLGLVRVRLFRPFSAGDFAAAIPKTAKAIAVLDRTKEPGAVGEPLWLDVVAALREEGRDLPVIGGRYGLSSKEFTPSMVAAVFDELRKAQPKRRFTVGIVDDVTHTSLHDDPEFTIEPDDVVRAVFFGLGADGTVGANKNSIKIIGEETEQEAQAYFVYDSKKSGAITISHLRFGPRPIRAPYLIRSAGFVACHQWNFVERYEMLDLAAPGATFLLNAPYPPDDVWEHLPREVQQTIVAKRLRFFVIDAAATAREAGLGGRINTIMQAAFFALSGVLPREAAIAKIKQAIHKSYEKKGSEIVKRNVEAVDAALSRLHEVSVPKAASATSSRPPVVPVQAPDFVQRVTAMILAGKGDLLPVSAFPVDGTWPTGTAKWEKRNLAAEIPIWDPEFCIQCNKCVLVCPHAAIRAKIYDPGALDGAPAAFRTQEFKSREHPRLKYTIQVAPEDCTGCNVCVQVCPGRDRSNPKHKAINMEPHAAHRAPEAASFDFFLGLPEMDRAWMTPDVKSTQLAEPLFEFSGACSGCGETPYLKLLSQMFGDRLLVANATGCSSIYGGNLPTTPWTVNREGRGPAWSNSLFEDNAEFGLGLRAGVDAHRRLALELLSRLAGRIGDEVVRELTSEGAIDDLFVRRKRAAVVELRARLLRLDDPEAAALDAIADYLVPKSVWIVGGDGWAYDIGFGGLDHVLASGRKVNVLVLDTEVYSNTGGQQSKATPLAASAKFAAAGKEMPKKDLGLIAMTYGHIYVARVAMGAKDAHTVRAFAEAEAHPGPSLVIAYSPCIAHGYDLALSGQQSKLAVDSGQWPLYRFDPERGARGEAPLQLDAAAPTVSPITYMRNEARFRMVEMIDPARFKALLNSAAAHAAHRVAIYEQLAGIKVAQDVRSPAPPPESETAGKEAP